MECRVTQRFRTRIFVFALAMAPLTSFAQISFSDVSNQAAFGGPTTSYGNSWGDINGDGWPDIFANNHARRHSVYRNNKLGGFGDVTFQVDGSNYWSGNGAWEDTHGGAWADVDNDGDQDLLVSTGICCDPQYYENVGGTLYYRSVEFGFGNDPDKGGRMPVWFDMDDDGRLDVILFGFYPVALLKQNSSGTFVNAKSGTGFSCGDDQFGQLIDLNANGELDILCVNNGGPFAEGAYDPSTMPFTNLTSTLPAVINVNDVIIGDFDNNLRNDMLLLRGALRPAEVKQFGNSYIEAQFVNNDRSFRFNSGGILNVRMDWNKTFTNFTNVNIGSQGVHPSSEDFQLDPSDTSTHGLQARDPNKSFGELMIGYNPSTQLWEFELYAANSFVYLYLEVDSSSAITNLVAEGIQGFDLPQKPALLSNLPSGFQDVITSAGDLNQKNWCVSGVAGDFDNDMDLDYYLACRGGVQNIENQLYENLGNGTFNLVPNEGGANSVTGAAVRDQVGTSDVVTIADYDIDGRLDLYLNNGLNMRPHHRNGGPDQLFRNTTQNAGRWVLLDLQGVVSNRDGIGAKVYATAGGVTQLREQNGGYHRWSEDHERIHFGLANNNSVDLRVEWPSGTVDQHNNVAADKLYRAIEGGALQVIDIGGGGDPPPPPSCGAPNYDPAADRAVFVWEDCQGMWHMRATAAGGFTRYQGGVTSDQGFTSVAPYSIESSDVLDTTTSPNAITFDLRVGPPNEDGFDFDFPDGSNVCFTVDAPGNATVLVGPGRTAVGGSFDPETLEPCSGATAPTLSIDDVSVPEAGGPASFTVSLFPESSETVTVDYATANGSATAGSDYAAASGTLTFSPGESSQSIDVSILDDGDSEGNEQFTVELSNASNAALGDASGTGTIVDDEVSVCGMPSYDPSADHGVFVWQDCATGAWSARFVAGNGFTRYQGMVDSSLGMDVTRISIESNDVVDTSNPNQTLYDLRVSPMWEDGFDFSYPSGSNVCFTVSAPTDATVRVGPGRTPVEQPFDPDTLGPCGSGGSQPALSIDDVSVPEASGPASFTVNLSPSAPDPVTVDYTTVAGTATAGSDYTGTSGTLMFSPGETSQSIDVTILDDGDSEGNEQFTVELSNASNAVLGDASGTGTIVDDEVSACGMPSYDSNVDHAVLVWQDCPGGAWHARFVAGNGFTRYIGSVASDQAFSMVSPYSIESSDVFDTSDPSTINYDLRVSPKWEDGFDFSYPAGANVCFGISAPGNAPVLIGSGRATISQPFNPDTLESC